MAGQFMTLKPSIVTMAVPACTLSNLFPCSSARMLKTILRKLWSLSLSGRGALVLQFKIWAAAVFGEDGSACFTKAKLGIGKLVLLLIHWLRWSGSTLFKPNPTVLLGEASSPEWTFKSAIMASWRSPAMSGTIIKPSQIVLTFRTVRSFLPLSPVAFFNTNAVGTRSPKEDATIVTPSMTCCCAIL